jgi:hypothetical protein
LGAVQASKPVASTRIPPGRRPGWDKTVAGPFRPRPGRSFALVTPSPLVGAGGRGRRLDRTRPEHRSGGGDVAVHLGDEVVDRIEALVVTEALDERDPGLLAVEIAVEVEEEGF